MSYQPSLSGGWRAAAAVTGLLWLGSLAAFIVIGQSDQQVKASEVAGALSEALVLTFEGVALAVPSIYFYALFRNRVMYIASSVILTADQFLRHFLHASRAKASAAASAKPAN